MFRAILTAIKPAPAQEAVIDFAVSLALQHQLTLEACSVIDNNRLAPAEPVPLGGGAFKAQRDEQVLESARLNAAAWNLRIEAESRARGVECSAQVREGDVVTILAAEVQRCDLLLCGHARGGRRRRTFPAALHPEALSAPGDYRSRNGLFRAGSARGLRRQRAGRASPGVFCRVWVGQRTGRTYCRL